MNRNDPAPSIWLVNSTTRKIAKGSVDRSLIAEAAAALLDEAGLDALTMRALGQRLDVSAMAFYAHVRHKDDILELAQDHAMGELHVDPGSWDEIVRSLAEDYRNLLVKHPWLPVLAGRFLNAGPNVTTMSTRAGQLLNQSGVPQSLVPFVLSAVFTLAHGHGAIEAAWRTRLSSTEPLDDLTRQLAETAHDDPVLRHRATAGASVSSGAEWRFALDCLVSGITTRLADTATGAS